MPSELNLIQEIQGDDLFARSHALERVIKEIFSLLLETTSVRSVLSVLSVLSVIDI